MGALDRFLLTRVLDDNLNALTGLARHAPDVGIQNQVNALIFEQGADSRSDVVILLMHQGPIALDHRDVAAEPAHRLR